MGRRRLPWSEIRDAYVMGDETVTLVVLAQRYSCSLDWIKKRSAKEDWPRQQRMFQARVSEQVRAKVLADQVEIRARHINVAKLMMALANQKLSKLLKSKSRDGEPDGHEALDVTEMRLLLKDAAEIERKAAGIGDVIDIGPRVREMAALLGVDPDTAEEEARRLLDELERRKE